MFTRLALIGLAATALSATDAAAQNRGDRPSRQDRDPRAETRSAPGMDLSDIVRRVSAGRPGRMLTANGGGARYIVRWEYPDGRISDISVDGRTGRVLGER